MNLEIRSQEHALWSKINVFDDGFEYDMILISYTTSKFLNPKNNQYLNYVNLLILGDVLLNI